MKFKYNSESERDKERDMKVYKSDKLIQQARYSLSITEQRFVLYAISKIKPEDDPSVWYDLDLRQFQYVCGTELNESYGHIKEWLKNLADRSWWLQKDGYETLVRWFSHIRLMNDSGIVSLQFDEDMFPFAFKLAEQMKIKKNTYTSYMFKYVLPMHSTYSVRLYELLKSYQKNNKEWKFEIDELKHLLDCDSYTRYPDFRRFVLETAIAEINKYTDISVEFDTLQKGRKVVAIIFKMLPKDMPEIINAQKEGLTELDGNIHYWDNK